VDPDPRFAASLRALLEAPLSVPCLEVPCLPPRSGDVVYASVWSPDRAVRRLSTAPCWWRVSADGRRVEGWGSTSGWVRCPAYHLPQPSVSDIDAAIDRVPLGRRTPATPSSTRTGSAPNAVDNQGLPFSLHLSSPASPLDLRPGRDVYFTMRVRDSFVRPGVLRLRLRLVLHPRQRSDGWPGPGPRPRLWLHGGHPRPPSCQYSVTDVPPPLPGPRRRGTATDPVQMPYGITSDCARRPGRCSSTWANSDHPQPVRAARCVSQAGPSKVNFGCRR